MAYSLESALIVPLTFSFTAFGIVCAVWAYTDCRRDSRREEYQDHFRYLHDRPVYEAVLSGDDTFGDVRTNPAALLRFCIYLEDQGGLLADYVPGIGGNGDE